MPTTVTVNSTGIPPVFIYLCDNPISNCVYIDSVSTFPYSFNIPIPLEGQTSYNVKIIDSNGCEKIENITL